MEIKQKTKFSRAKDSLSDYLSFIEKIRKKEARISVIGLGYVGLPLAVLLAQKGFDVFGIERNIKRVNMVNLGYNYISDIHDDDLREVVDQEKLKATQEFKVVSESDIIIICVPTPLDKNKVPVTEYIENVVDNSIRFMKKGQLIVLESTTYPGTTEEIIKPRVESRGYKVGEDIFLAFSPERIDPGNKKYSLKNIPKVVGGITAQCSEITKTLYEEITSGGVFVVSSPKVAEMEKLLENIFRIVNISLVNELAILCDRMGINIWEVIEAAKSKPYGFMAFYPGPGTGGHCIPQDPFYLSWKAKEYDFSTRFIKLAGEINDNMPEYVVSRVADVLNERGKCLKKARILLVGMAYKRDVEDIRESPALKIAEILCEKGAILSYHDSYIPKIKINGVIYPSSELTQELLKDSDLVLITTDHTNIDYNMIVEYSECIYDTRNVLKDINSENIYRLGSGKK